MGMALLGTYFASFSKYFTSSNVVLTLGGFLLFSLETTIFTTISSFLKYTQHTQYFTVLYIRANRQSYFPELLSYSNLLLRYSGLLLRYSDLLHLEWLGPQPLSGAGVQEETGGSALFQSTLFTSPVMNFYISLRWGNPPLSTPGWILELFTGTSTGNLHL